MKKCIAVLLAVLLTITGCFSLNVAAATEDSAEIISADMTLDSAKNNADGYFSNDVWTAEYPEGLYVIEYNSYEITEGGPDPENPEDIYLGIVVYRIGGNSQSATLNYELITISGDKNMYPDSIGSIDFAPQQVTATAKVKIPNDNKRNGNQLLMMNLTKASSGMISDASTTMIKVFDDEPYVESVVTMVSEKAVADMNEGGIQVTLKRTENDTDYCTVLLKTSDDTAKEGKDYKGFEEEVVFSSGVTEQKVTIPFLKSSDKFTEPKYFNLTMENIRGGVAGETDSIRLGVTNCLEKGKGTLIDVSDAKADLTIDEGSSVVDSVKTVLNENDTLDRTDMLRAAVGAVNGKAVSILSETGGQALLESTGDGNYWSDTLYISPGEFEALYNTGDKWESGGEYKDDDEDLLVATTNTYNLNLYDAIVYSFYSKDSTNTGFTGNPNISLGYLDNNGHTYNDNNLGYAPEDYDLNNTSSSCTNWMTENDIYILKNYTQTNVDAEKQALVFELFDKNGNRHPRTSNSEGSKMKPFYFVYNVKGQDDNHFKIFSTQLKRAVIPFTLFEKNEKFDVLDDNTGFTFEKNNYIWTFKVDMNNKEGGVVIDAVTGDACGFYAGSELRVKFEPKTAGASNPIPTVLYLTDSNGVVHNFSKQSDESFLFTLETNMCNDTSLMQNDYYMTEAQAASHNDVLTNGGCINSTFKNELTIECQYAIQQGVEITYKDIPHVYEDLTYYSEDSQKASIYERLSEVVKFYKDGEEVNITPEVKLNQMCLSYEIVDFDYVTVDPAKAGGDVKAVSNLYSSEYKTITSKTNIDRFVCAQISTAVNFRLTYLDTDYVDPSISLASTFVSSKENGEFETGYIANYIDDNIPFEALFSDRTQTPKVSYYSMNFVISDVYVGEKTSEMAIKDYPVTVYSGDIDGRNNQKLLSFTYHGGASYTQASELALEIEEGVFDEKYLPEIELLRHSSNGYEYQMHIPVYYNYHNPNDVTYPAIIKGGQGISIEIGNYDNGDGEAHNEIVTSLQAKDSQYVCQKLIDIEGVAPAQEAPGLYFEQQEEFYTYTDHVINSNTSPVTLDLTTLGTTLSKIYALRGKGKASDRAYMATGNGAYIKFLDNQMTIGVKLGINTDNLVPKPKEPLPGIEMVEMSDNQLSAENIMGFEIPVMDPVTDKKSIGSTIKGAASKTNAAYDYFAASFFMEAKVDLTYNSVRNEWDFSAFNAGVTGGFSFSKGIPIPAAADLVYVSFSIAGSLGVSSGFSAIRDYTDLDGNVNYAFAWNGITIAPAFAVSFGVGVGLCGLLSFEAGGSAEFGAAMTFGEQEVSPKLADFDLDTNDADEDDKSKITDTYSGNWKTCLVSNTASDNYLEDEADEYFFNNTYVISENKGDVVVIEGEGTAIQLTGVTKSDGGKIKVTLYTDDSETPVQEPQILSLESDRTYTHATIFEWKMADFDDPAKANPVKLKMVVENEGGKVILDSAKLFREDNYSVKETPFTFDWATVRLSMYVKFSVAFLSLNLEPGYMLIQYSDSDDDFEGSITLGTVYYSKTWDISDSKRMVANQNEDIPLVMVGDSGVVTDDAPDYFDTGAFGSEKRKTLIQGNVSKSSKTQVLNFGGDTVSFFTELTTDEKTGNSRYGLYCNLPDYGNVLVSDDVYVGDFKAYIDNNSELCVEITASDSTVKNLTITENSTAQLLLSDGKKVDVSESSALSEVLKRTCVKVALYNGDGTFTSQTIKETDGNLYQESAPAVAVTDKNVVAFFVEDEAEYNSDFKLNWEGFDENSTAAADVENLMNAMFTGQGVVRYSVGNGTAFGETQKISLKESFESRFSSDILSGIRVTEIAADTADDGTICLAYAVELPNARVGVHQGTLKEIHYREGKASGNSVTFSDALIVDSVMDYDEDVADVLKPEEYTSKYYNSATGEFYNSPILRNIQVENVSLNFNSSENAQVEPCIFYQTNSGINAVSHSTLSEALASKNSGADSKCKLNVIYNGFFNDYIVAASEEGYVSIIYIENTDTSSYTDTLNIIDYDYENKVWNHSRQLTHSDIFDPDALSDRRETYGMTIENFSAYMDSRGDVSVAFKSNYAPFTYEYGVPYSELIADNAPVDVINQIDGEYVNNNNETIEYMITPMLDFESEEARSDIYSITFKKRVSAIEVDNFNMLNKIFTPGETISLSFDIENIGDTVFNKLNLELYLCDEERRLINPVVSKVLTGASENESEEEGLTGKGLLAGDRINQSFNFKLENVQTNTPLLCLKITDGNGEVMFDSFDSYLANTNTDETDDKEVTYHVISNSPELVFNAVDVDVNAQGIMNFRTDISNIGTMDMTKSATVYFKAYSEDENGNLEAKTLFSFIQHPLAAGSSDVYSDTYKVGEYIKNGELKYSFDINYDEPQFETANDSTGVITNFPNSEIVVNSAAVSSVLNQSPAPLNSRGGVRLALGDVMELDNEVKSENYGNIHLRAYEIGSDCLSIDNSSSDGRIKVKAVKPSEDGRVKLLLNIKGTTIYRLFYVYITDKNMIDFDSEVKTEGFNVSDKTHRYATSSDVFVTDKNNSSFTFNFYGDDLSLYGNRLANGGKFRLTVTDSTGKVLIDETVSTKSELKDYGMLLFKSEKLNLDNYEVKVQAILEDGETLALDHAKFTINTDDADVSPYASVGEVEEILDAPLVNGRVRKARFNLKFSNRIKLAEGVSYKDISVLFDEYELVDGEYVATGNTVTFTAEEIKDGNILVLSSELSSKQGAILKYVLKDSEIPENSVVTIKGTAVKTAIPDYDKVSYVLKESGILSVTVADDNEMPDGSVQKSVNVKFMTTPDISRLKGTKLLYNTVDSKGETKAIEFKFVKLTNDPRVALYRADALKLEKDEMSKVFRFERGIVLNDESYVLVTAEGDYLDNNISQVITDKSQLDITYNKLEAVNSELAVISDITENGIESTFALYADFEDKVDISNLNETSRAFVKVNAEFTDNTTEAKETKEFTLFAQSLSEDGKTLCFKADESIILGKGKTVKCTLKDSFISYTDEEASVVSAYDGIAVNPKLLDTESLSFNTSAYIISATPYFKDGSFKVRDNVLCAEVVLSGAVDTETLKGTTLKVYETATEYDYIRNTDYELTYVSAELKGEGDKAFTVAVYELVSDKDTVSFTSDQYRKTFSVDDSLTFAESAPIKSADGKEVYSAQILEKKRVSVSRLLAEGAELSLIENGTEGYKLGADIKFGEDIKVYVTDQVYAVADRVVNGESSPIYLTLKSAENNVLHFECDTPFSFKSGDITTFTLRNRFTSPATFVTDSQGMPVCELTGPSEDLVADYSFRGLALDADVKILSAQKDKAQVSAKVTFDEALNENSFKDSKIKSQLVIYYSDGGKTVTEATLVFSEIENEKEALFTAELTVPKDAVAAELILGTEISPASGSFIYNLNRTVILSTLVPESKDLELSKICAKKTAFFVKENKEKIDSLNDVEIHVIYHEAITAEEIEGISLNASVRGIKGITDVLFKAVKVADGNVLVFAPSKDVEGEYASAIVLSLKNSIISVDEKSALYSTNSGISVSTAVNDAEATLLTVFDDVYVPTDTAPVETETATTALEEVTEILTEAVTENTETKPIETETVTQTEDKSDSQSGDSLTTGAAYRYIIMAAVLLMAVSAIAVVLLRKKKA